VIIKICYFNEKDSLSVREMLGNLFIIKFIIDCFFGSAFSFRIPKSKPLLCSYVNPRAIGHHRISRVGGFVDQLTSPSRARSIGQSAHYDNKDTDIIIPED